MTVLIVGDVIDDIVVRPTSRVVIDSDTAAQITSVAGGSAANQAAWLGFLGVPVRFVARVARADVARHRGELEPWGVEPFLVPDDDVATGHIVVLLGDGGERSMFTDRGANERLCAADLPLSLLDGIDLVHVNGYTLFAERTRAPMLLLMQEARRRDIALTVDPCSAAFLAAAQPFLEWTAGASVCFPNLDEAFVLTGESDADAAAVALRVHYPTVVLKLGSGGLLVAHANGPLTRIAAVAGEVRDTTGAGDALCAGFLAASLSGADTVEAAHAGARAAAMAVSISGGRPRLPT